MEGFLAVVEGPRVVVASRLHALILSAVAGCPLVAVSPTRKATRQMADLDLAGWCLAMDGLEADRLVERVRRAVQDHRTLRSKIAQRVEGLRVRLEDAFEDLAAAIPERSAARRTLVCRPYPIRSP